MNGQHYTPDQLQMAIDGSLTTNEQAMIKDHVRTCIECGRAHAALLRVHRGMKKLPLEKTSSDFTRNVLVNLGIAPKSPLLFRLLEKSAYMFGLFIVLGIMLAAFVATGVIEMRQITEGGSYVRNLLTTSGGFADKGIGAFSNALKQYLPFAFGKGSMAISVFAMLVVAALAIADKLFGGRIVHRIR